MSLFSAEIESITAIGDILGRYSLDIQKQAIEGSLILLRENEKKAAQEFPQLKRLSLGLSVSAGMLLGIFLI